MPKIDLFYSSFFPRSLLISYHVLGRIPSITFVKGKSHNMTRIHELLESADYGPGFEAGIKTHSVPGYVDGDDSYAGDAVKVRNARVNQQHKPQPQDEFCTIDETYKTSSNAIDSIQDYFKAENLHFHSNLYSLPHEDIMKKLKAKNSRINQPQEMKVPVQNFNSQILRPSKMRERYDKKDTKTKQKLLEVDFNKFDEY